MPLPSIEDFRMNTHLLWDVCWWPGKECSLLVMDNCKSFCCQQSCICISLPLLLLFYMLRFWSIIFRSDKWLREAELTMMYSSSVELLRRTRFFKTRHNCYSQAAFWFPVLLPYVLKQAKGKKCFQMDSTSLLSLILESICFLLVCVHQDKTCESLKWILESLTINKSKIYWARV